MFVVVGQRLDRVVAGRFAGGFFELADHVESFGGVERAVVAAFPVVQQHQGGEVVDRVFFLAGDRHLEQVDQGVAELVVEDEDGGARPPLGRPPPVSS